MNVEYQNISCTNSTRSADDIIKNYLNIRIKILENLKKDPKNLILNLWDNILNYDSDCKCNMGVYDKENILKSNFRCIQCTNLDRITDLSENLIGTPFSINVGKYIGKELIIDMYKNIVLKATLTDKYKYSAEYITKYYNKLSVCDSNLNLKQQYFVTDKFTNNFLISTILDSINNRIATIHTAYICGTDGYTLNDIYFSLDEYIQNLKDSTRFAKSLFTQLIHFFVETSKYNFTHNNATLDSLQFSVDKNGFSLKFCNFENSCLNFANCRFLNFSTYSELFIKDEPIIEDIETKIVTFEKVGLYSMYKFNHEVGKKILHLRRLGVNIYSSSLDLYCYLIALTSNSKFYNILKSDIEMFKLFKSIWRPEQFEGLEKRLYRNMEKSNVDIDLILQTLSGLSLRCDLLFYLQKAL